MLALSGKPELLSHIMRWVTSIDHFDAAGEKFGYARSEAALRMMWEKTRALNQESPSPS
jgi:hypothetical protein